MKLGLDKGQLARPICGLKERELLDAQVDEAHRRSVATLTADECGQLVALLLKVSANRRIATRSAAL